MSKAVLEDLELAGNLLRAVMSLSLPNRLRIWKSKRHSGHTTQTQRRETSHLVRTLDHPLKRPAQPAASLAGVLKSASKQSFRRLWTTSKLARRLQVKSSASSILSMLELLLASDGRDGSWTYLVTTCSSLQSSSSLPGSLSLGLCWALSLLSPSLYSLSFGPQWFTSSSWLSPGSSTDLSTVFYFLLESPPALDSCATTTVSKFHLEWVYYFEEINI